MSETHEAELNSSLLLSSLSATSIAHQRRGSWPKFHVVQKRPATLKS
jgi:hypothetical protein